MANISYGRFENTCKDLQDCINHLNDKDPDETESKFRDILIELCKEYIKVSLLYDWLKKD